MAKQRVYASKDEALANLPASWRTAARFEETAERPYVQEVRLGIARPGGQSGQQSRPRAHRRPLRADVPCRRSVLPVGDPIFSLRRMTAGRGN